jgi:hypothetical protein
MSNRSVENHLTATPNAEPERRMKPGSIEVDHRFPDRFDHARIETEQSRCNLGLSPGGHRLRLEHPHPLGGQPSYLPAPHPALLPLADSYQPSGRVSR